MVSGRGKGGEPGAGAPTGPGLGPEQVFGLVARGGYDVEEDEGVALAEEVAEGPTQRCLAALGEVQRHPDLPIAPCHPS